MQRKGNGAATATALEPPRVSSVTEEEARHALDRVLRGEAFHRSERLQRFLQFVCDQTLQGEGARINEYLIGAEVFHRGADYSPTEDGIVRRQAHALRRKLQEYYAKEGRNDPVRIELPVGRYVPAFRKKEDESEPERATVPRPPIRWVALPAAAVAVFALGWLAGSRSTAPPAPQTPAEIREIWGGWLTDPAGAVVCFSNPLTAVIKHFQEPLPPGTQPPRMRFTPEQDRFFRSVVSLPSNGYLYFAPAISQAKMGEAIAGVRLAALFAGAGRPVRATQTRFLTWESLTRENVILLGHNEANPWLDRVLEPYPFKLSATHGDKQRAIVNAKPAAGEKLEYQIHYADGALTATEEYALISMIPGVDGRHRLLLINGLNTQATQIAADFLTSPARLKELASELRGIAPRHEGPWHFQAVLRTEVYDKVPTKASLLALKVLP